MNLDHTEIKTASGASVVILDKGEQIDSEAEAMLQALHSRSTGGLKTHLQTLEEKGADNFMSRFYVGYGHKSIGDCGSATIFIEGVSMLVAKAIQDTKLYSGQESSTRYVDYSKQKFLDITNSKLGQEIMEMQRKFYLESLEPIKNDLKKKFPIQEGEKETIYNKAIAAKAFDIARGFLPAGTSTNLAWHSNLRQIADRILFLRHHPLKEVREIANAIEKAVLIKFPNSFTTERFAETEEYLTLVSDNYYYHNPNQKDFEVKRIDFDKEEFDKYKPLIEKRPNSKTELPQYLNYLGEICYSFKLDFGSWRDLQRHRAINQRMPLLTTELGFNDFYLNELSAELREKAKQHLEKLNMKLLELGLNKEELQYFIPMGYNTANIFSGSIPATLYMVELRATRFVHPTLRKIAQQMGKHLQNELGITVHLDTESDRFDIARGQQDIVMK